jgi:hypothetical protein
VHGRRRREQLRRRVLAVARRSGGRTVLFFSSGRNGVQQIYTSERDANGAWGPAEPVEELNSGFQDARPNVSHDSLEIVFDSTRDGGAPDIWTATRSKLSRQWSAPRKLDTNVNSDAVENRPSLSWDGLRLYFGSTRQGAIRRLRGETVQPARAATLTAWHRPPVVPASQDPAAAAAPH